MQEKVQVLCHGGLLEKQRSGVPMNIDVSQLTDYRPSHNRPRQASQPHKLLAEVHLGQRVSLGNARRVRNRTVKYWSGRNTRSGDWTVSVVDSSPQIKFPRIRLTSGGRHG